MDSGDYSERYTARTSSAPVIREENRQFRSKIPGDRSVSKRVASAHTAVRSSINRQKKTQPKALAVSREGVNKNEMVMWLQEELKKRGGTSVIEDSADLIDYHPPLLKIDESPRSCLSMTGDLLSPRETAGVLEESEIMYDGLDETSTTVDGRQRNIKEIDETAKIDTSLLFSNTQQFSSIADDVSSLDPTSKWRVDNMPRLSAYVELSSADMLSPDTYPSYSTVTHDRQSRHTSRPLDTPDLINKMDSLLPTAKARDPPLSPKAKKIMHYLDSSVDDSIRADDTLFTAAGRRGMSIHDSYSSMFTGATSEISAIPEPFFDPASSSATKGRYRVNDARDFDAKTLRFENNATDAGVSYLVGKKTKNVWTNAGKMLKGQSIDTNEEDVFSDEEKVVTILFDRSVFSEEQAKLWWERNKFLPLFCSSPTRR